ncbi:MAG: hypothetical protein M1281_09700 [Chloroflexi bacterium]|nr:hypothetical protein [Chloroflexota bacterium]
MAKPAFYQLRVEGHLDPDWSEWFEGLVISQEGDGITVIAGRVRDQAVLFGLLTKVRDLGLTLVSVNRLPISP